MAPSKGIPSSRILLILAKVAVLICTLIYFIFVCINFWGGSDTRYANGKAKQGDLQQHYAAAVFWSEGKSEALYRGFHLGSWLNDWHEKNWQEPSDNIQSFNYVYTPLLAAISSWFLFAPWHSLVSSWFNLILLFYLITCGILIFSHRHLKQPVERHLPIFLILGFPSFYYTLIPFQNTTLTLLIVISSGILLDRKAPFLAGLVLSCAFYKPQYMPYFCLFGIFAFPWRFTLALVIGNLAWLGLGILICGIEAHSLWLTSLKDMSSGVQFQRDGLNQSWRGFFLTLLPSSPRIAIDLFSHALGFTTLVITGLLCRLAPTKISWNHSYSLYLCLVVWLLISPYVGHYEILLTVPFWFVIIRHHSISLKAKTILICSIWLISMFSITGQTASINITSPLLTAWFIYAYLQCLHTDEMPKKIQEIRTTWKKHLDLCQSPKELGRQFFLLMRSTY